MNDKLTSEGAELPSVTQLLNLANTIGIEVGHYLVVGGITKERLQALPVEEQKRIAREIAHDYLKLVPEPIQAAKALLAKFFLEVFNLKVDLSKLIFPTREGFNAFMVSPPKLSEDEIMGAYKAKWNINLYKWMDPVAKQIDRANEQRRPKGLYVFAHRGGDEPDAEHLGKSYDDAKAAQMLFLNPKEYLLATGFHRFTKGYFMDKKGWTRTSSLWSGGRLVVGGWGPGYSGLCLGHGLRGDRDSDCGPRELVFS